MPGSFTITAASNSVRLDSQGHGEALFTVSNTRATTVRGRAQLAPLAPPVAAPEGGATPVRFAAWLALAGEAEHEFGPHDTAQYQVTIQAPPGAPAGTYRFRLDMVGVANPDEDYTQGPAVAFDVPEPQRRPFPWWIVIVAAAVLLLGGGLTAFLLSRDRTPPPTDTPTPTVTVTPTPTPTITPTPEPEVAPPTNLEALRLADGSVRFTWTDAVGEASYSYEIAVVGGGLGAARADTLPADTTSFDGGDLDCGDVATFALTAFDADGDEIGRVETSLEVPDCPPETVVLSPIPALSGSLSAEGCSGYPPVQTGIAPAGNGIRGLVSFDIAALKNQGAILEATLDLSDFEGDPFEFIQPLHIEHVTFSDRCDYPAAYSGPALAGLIDIPAALPGLNNPVDVAAALTSSLAAGDGDTFQIKLYFEHDDAGAAFAGLVRWPTIQLTVRYQP